MPSLCAQEYSNFSLQQLLTVKIASRQSETVYQAPSSVYVVSREQLDLWGIDNLQSLLNFVPGFQTSRDVEQGTAARISARGRSTALSESVLIQIDGQRINDLYTGGTSILNRLLTLDNVAKIEIIRGPGSALYGSNAFLGVVNIITAQDKNKLSLHASSFEGYKVSTSFSPELEGEHKLQVFVSAFDQQGDTYQVTDVNGLSGRTQDPISGEDFYMSYAYQDWQINLRHNQSQLGEFLAFGTLDNQINSEKTRQSSLVAKYQTKWASSWQANASINLSQDSWRALATILPQGFELAPGVNLDPGFRFGPLLKSRSFGGNIELNYQFSLDNRFTFGAAFENSRIFDVANVASHNPVTLDYYGGELVYHRQTLNFNRKAERKNHSFYLQNRHNFNESWHLTLGVRVDDYNDFGDSTNPRVALIWNQDDKQSVKFMFGSAFRAPNFLELYDQNNPVDFGNPNLLAEEVETSELAWLYSGSNWRSEITFFHNHYKNLIRLGAPQVSPLNPLQAPTFYNGEADHSTGAELAYQMSLGESLGLRVNWNWFTNDSAIDVARNNGSLIVDYQLGDWQVSFNGYYRGRQPQVANQESYWVAGFNLNKTLNSKMTLSLSGNNIFNKTYYTPSQLLPEGVINPGSEFKLGLDWRF